MYYEQHSKYYIPIVVLCIQTVTLNTVFIVKEIKYFISIFLKNIDYYFMIDEKIVKL